MSVTPSNARSEEQVRQVIDAWATRVAKTDIPGVMDLYDPGVIVYDALGSHRLQGTEAYIAHWKACIESCPDGTQISSFDLHKIDIHVDGSVAFAHFLHHVVFPGKDGGQASIWMRSTFGLRRQPDGEWKIVHDHSSAPFDVQTGKSLCNSQP